MLYFMTVYAITDTKKGRTRIAPTYLQTTRILDVPFALGMCGIDFFKILVRFWKKMGFGSK